MAANGLGMESKGEIKMITKITLTITHKKPIIDLLDKVAGRSYTISGVDDVSATTDAGWLPIESAPTKAGERVLVIKDCGKGTLESVSLAYPLDDGEWYFDGGSNKSLHAYGYRVTHWMPLPQPPKEQT